MDSSYTICPFKVINQQLEFSFLQYFKKENQTPMNHTLPISSFDSEIIYDSEESAPIKRLEDEFLDEVLEKALDEDSETRIKREVKTKGISKKQTHYNLERITCEDKLDKIYHEDRIQNQEKKQRISSHYNSSTLLFPSQSLPGQPHDSRRKRNNTKSGKWSGANRNNYYKAILKFTTEHPYYTVSWRYWKPEKFYPKMIEQINKNELYYKKDVIQTKSFDQRQRKEYFEKEPKLDMIELSIIKVKEMQAIDPEAIEILKNYNEKMKEKSRHMGMLEEALVKMHQKKYQLEDLYVKVMGPSKVMVQECPNSVFYS